MPYQVPPSLRTDTEQVPKPSQWAEASSTVHQELKKINRRDQLSLILQHAKD